MLVQCIGNFVEVSTLLWCALWKETLGAAACCMSWQYFVFDYLRRGTSHRVLHSITVKFQSVLLGALYTFELEGTVGV